jgi:hypothetical protein
MTIYSLVDGPHGRPPGRRQVPRVRLALPGQVILVTGHEPGMLDDLSQSGGCVTLGGPAPPIGAGVVLMVQGVEAFGSVVWRSGSRFGMVFEAHLAKDDVVRLRTVHDRFQEMEQEQNRRRAREYVQGRRFF